MKVLSLLIAVLVLALLDIRQNRRRHFWPHVLCLRFLRGYFSGDGRHGCLWLHTI